MTSCTRHAILDSFQSSLVVVCASRTRKFITSFGSFSRKEEVRKNTDLLICSHYFKDESSTLMDKIHLWRKKQILVLNNLHHRRN